MQKGGGCKTDWRWEGKCSSPGGCCKGGRKRRTRRRRRQKRGRGKKHKSSPTSRDKYSGPERRTLTEKKHKTLTEKKHKTLTEKKERPPSGRTVSTVSGTSLKSQNTAFNTSLGAAADPRHQLQAIIGAGGPGQTDDERRRRIAAVIARMPGRAGKRASSPRMIAQESSPDLFDYHQATVGGELGGAFGGPRTSPVTFSEVLMEPKLRKWEKDVQQEEQQKEAKKQWKKALKLRPIPQPKFAVIREQYGGRKRRTRRRKRSRYGGNNNLQIEDDFVKYHDFLNKRLPEGLLAPRWRPGELASHTVISPDSNRPTIKKKSRKPPPLPLRARREAQARRAATIPIGDFGGNHFDLERPAGKKAAKKAARRQRLKRWAAENAAGASEGGRRRRRRTRHRKRRGGEFANNVRGHNVSTFNSAAAEKEWGPAKEPIKRDMITPERKKRYDRHIAKLKPKEWWNPGTWFGGGRRRTRKQRGGKIEKLTSTDMMRSSHILGHKINAIIDVVNQHHQSAGTGGTGGMRKTRRNRRRKKSRKSAR